MTGGGITGFKASVPDPRTSSLSLPRVSELVDASVVTVILFEPAAFMITSSPGAGILAGVQLAAVFQGPPAVLFQVIVSAQAREQVKSVAATMSRIILTFIIGVIWDVIIQYLQFRCGFQNQRCGGAPARQRLCAADWLGLRFLPIVL
jgi:hypothetical protein